MVCSRGFDQVMLATQVHYDKIYGKLLEDLITYTYLRLLLLLLLT